MKRCKLRSERYEYIKKVAVKVLIECNINSIPLDPFEICNIRKYKLIKYTEKYTHEEMEQVVRVYPMGFNYYLNGERIIEYNDTLSLERIRTTIFHEIGHIELKHSCSCDLAETEAEWFAAYIIAPPPLVNILNIDNYNDISIMFFTSSECAWYSLNRYKSWKFYSYNLKDYEQQLINQFIDTDVVRLEMMKK